jgi:hypothetical protein
MVPQAVVDHVIPENAGPHAVAGAGFFQVVGRHAHGFHAAGHDHIGIAHLDGLGRQHDGLEGRAADLVDRDAFHRIRQAGLDGRLFGRILAIAAAAAPAP